MITEIGLIAGEILEILDRKASIERSSLKTLGHEEELILMALGWLCREGYVQLKKSKEGLVISKTARGISE